MSVLEQLGDKLAQDVLEHYDTMGGDDFVREIAKSVGASSTTLEEAFMTSIRMRLADRRARARMVKLLQEAKG